MVDAVDRDGEDEADDLANMTIPTPSGLRRRTTGQLSGRRQVFDAFAKAMAGTSPAFRGMTLNRGRPIDVKTCENELGYKRQVQQPFTGIDSFHITITIPIMDTPTPTPTTSRPDDIAVSWVGQLLSILVLVLSLCSEYHIFTPDTAMTNFRITLTTVHVLAVLAPLFTRRDRPHQWLATVSHWVGISALLCIFYMTLPNTPLKFFLLPVYIVTAFLLTALVITCLLLLVERKFDSERLGVFGEIILWMADKIFWVYRKILSRPFVLHHDSKTDAHF
ncbi:hypothetical protein E1B28_005266 [Marasmius oreades]|uniref:Transmembrane protein n=1 Tax=Marasmius oreades TaxID=181124 RepID=A0A9P7V0H4_9AGAR|nr:uncharacterized protein E1B28_005266 [Marasmius oreades]KAG7097955.1 hypothetical protein E1B28_005266 [Marasmius oreades]